jgi:hypothetical protein
MNRRHVALGLVVLAVGLAGAAYGISNTYFASEGVTYVTDSGVAVTLGNDTQVQSGNPFNDSQTVRLRNVSVSGNGSADLTLEQEQPLEVGSVATGDTWVELNNTVDGVRPVEIAGDADQITIRDVNLSRDVQNTDVVWDSNNQGSIRFNTSLAADTTVLAVDKGTDTVVSSTTVTESGGATFDSVPSGTYDIDFRRGPSALRIFNESSPNDLISGNATLRIRFFVAGSEEVIERTATNGTISLGGLPADEEIIVTVDDEGSNYTYRRVILESLYQQQSVYLLPNSLDNVGVTFQLDDKTGSYSPQQSRLYVEKPVEKDYDSDGTNETRYVTIVGDRFGADGRFPAVLEPNQRYRLRVENQDGNSRVLGAYSASTGGVIQVPIGEVSIDGRGIGGASFGASIETVNGSQYIRVRYTDQENITSELDLEITGRNANASTIRPNTTEIGPFGTYTETFQVPDSDGGDASYRIRFHAERDNRDDFGGMRLVGSPGPWDLPVDPAVLSLLGWVALVGITGAAVLVDDRIGAFTAPVIAAGFSTVGIITIPTVALGIAGAIAILYNIGRFRR